MATIVREEIPQGHNVVMSLDEKNILTLEIDLNERGQPSQSGKSMLVGTTSGFFYTNGIGISVNVTRKVQR